MKPRQPPQHRRTGVSLLEVLISIGVVSVGLLGVLTLVVVGGHEKVRGIVNDRIGATGRNAYREFRIRDMNNPQNWVAADGSPVAPPTGFNLNNSAPAAVCIDPLGIAFSNGGGGAQGLMPTRISLRKGPSRQAGAMSAAQAMQVFIGHDDLIFQPNPTEGMPPIQEMQGNQSRRADHSRYSWMAMLSSLHRDNTYRLSIIVYFNRDLSGNGGGEASVGVNFLSGGFGGGEVELSAATVSALAINPDEWMMLTATEPTAGLPIFRWYRVISAESGVSGSGPYTRQVTLVGPDWDATLGTTGVTYNKPDARIHGSGGSSRIINNPPEGVVGVYEKIIRLQDSSLWTTQ